MDQDQISPLFKFVNGNLKCVKLLAQTDWKPLPGPGNGTGLQAHMVSGQNRPHNRIPK